jgi:hypothetical protein
MMVDGVKRPPLAGQGGLVCLPVDDLALQAHLPNVDGEFCRMCVCDSGGSGAEYVIWMGPRDGRPHLPICGVCLEQLIHFFRWWPWP